jgi:hypothetical protein
MMSSMMMEMLFALLQQHRLPEEASFAAPSSRWERVRCHVVAMKSNDA